MSILFLRGSTPGASTAVSPHWYSPLSMKCKHVQIPREFIGNLIILHCLIYFRILSVIFKHLWKNRRRTDPGRFLYDSLRLWAITVHFHMAARPWFPDELIAFVMTLAASFMTTFKILNVNRVGHTAVFSGFYRVGWMPTLALSFTCICACVFISVYAYSFIALVGCRPSHYHHIINVLSIIVLKWFYMI